MPLFGGKTKVVRCLRNCVFKRTVEYWSRESLARWEVAPGIRSAPSGLRSLRKTSAPRSSLSAFLRLHLGFEVRERIEGRAR